MKALQSLQATKTKKLVINIVKKKSVSAPHRTSQFFEKISPHRTSPHIIIFLPHPHRTRTPPHIRFPLKKMNLEEV